METLIERLDEGNVTGIDLLAYIGYLHAGLKEATATIKSLDARIKAVEPK
jgi:hypothetical protein